jgi:hypothetical protein
VKEEVMVYWVRREAAINVDFSVGGARKTCLSDVFDDDAIDMASIWSHNFEKRRNTGVLKRLSGIELM